MRFFAIVFLVVVFQSSFCQVGDWPPAYWGYSYFGATAPLDQNNPANYALVQDKNNGKTYLNSPVEIHFNLSGADKMFLSNAGNFGIGTTSPGAKLEVHGNAAIGQYTNGTAVIDAFNSFAYFGCNSPTNGLAVGPSGNIGIGTSATGLNTRLNVVGGALEISAAAHQADASLHISTSFGGADRLTQINPSLANKPGLNLMASTDATANYNWWSWGVNTAGNWAFQPSTSFGGTTGMFIDRAGNVGIGSTAPDQKLTVNGTVHATRVKVETTVPGPDYVFEKSYSLPTLDEVKSYIDENKHLPEVPSAKEMEAKGIDVGEMNMLLLKKVEELTLYVIELKKENERQQLQIEKLVKQ